MPDLPADMLAITLAGRGGPEMLIPTRLPLPALEVGAVLIAVEAAGVNYPDVAQRRGHYDPPPGHSPVPGLEVAGTVAALGADVDGFALGQRVMALCNGGGYAQFAAVPAGQVLRVPEGLGMERAAAMPETWFTITQTLVMRAGLLPGMRVLIHGAAGGIGGAAIQIALASGAEPIAVVSSPEKAAYAESLGARAVIDHSRTDFVAAALEATGGRGADRIVSLAGGDMIARNIQAAATGAWIVQLAGLSGDRVEIGIGRLLAKDITLIGSTLRKQDSATKAAIAAELERRFWPAIGDGRIVPPEPRAYRLEAAAEAHRAMEERGHFGKLVLLAR